MPRPHATENAAKRPFGTRGALALLALLAEGLCASPARSAGPDDFGYLSVGSTEAGGAQLAPDTFVDIVTTGERLTFLDADALPAQNANADDGVAIDRPLTALNGGLGFPFYGTFRTTVHMSTNGFLTFELNGSSDSLANNCPVTNAAEPNDIIAALWDDLVLRNPPSTIAGGYQQAFSPCPYEQGGRGECVIFQWDKADHFGGGIDSLTFQAVLYDSGNILMVYGSGNPEKGSGSTTGLEAAAAVTGITHVCDTTDSVLPDTAVLFLTPAPAAASSHEEETNDTPADATPLPAGSCGAGTLASDDTTDHWVLSDVAAGDRVYVLVDAPAAIPDATPVVDVLADDGVSVLRRGDPAGSGRAAAVAGAVVSAAGDVFLRVNAAAGDVGPYGLVSLVVSSTDRQREAQGNDVPETATAIASTVTSGTVAGGDVDHFSFPPVAVGDIITVMVDNDPDGDGLLSDTVVELIGPDGTSVLAANESAAGRRSIGLGRIVVETAGQHVVRIRQGGAAEGTDYDLAVLVNCKPACTDGDGDGTCDGLDNCGGLENDQADADRDGVGDACEECAADAAKTEPGICGCGVSDEDANGNGVADCLLEPELRARLDDLELAVQALRRKRVRRTQPNPLVEETLRRLNEVVGLLRAEEANLRPVGTSDAVTLADELERTVVRATKTGAARFGKRRSKALATVQKVRDAVATDVTRP